MKSKRKKFRFSTVNLRKFQLKHKIFAFFLILFILIFCYIRLLATPVIINNTDSQLSASATKSINLAVSQAMTQNISYGDLVTVIRDGQGDVSHIEANSIRINLLSKTLSKIVMQNFLEQSKYPIKISLGAFSGIVALSGFGPKIAFDISPFGEVLCNFSSSFESAGINQTYHKIYLEISLKVNVVFPFKVLQVTRASEVLLCETLIVGKIPDVYLNSNSLSHMLDLVPERFSSTR